MIALVAVVVCVAIVLGVYPLVKKSSSKTTESGDSTQLTLSETPTAKNTSNVPSSEDIAAKAEKFNVGIKLYGQSQSIFSSSSKNSLVGEGSGIIMGEDSSKKYTYIVTCAHVISEVKTSGYTMTVTDYEGNNYDGILVGYDSKTDVGVIKIQKTGLTAAEFGDSTTLKKGQTVYAIGNPGGSEFFGSFTKGMVSAIDRPISSESGYEMKCIQHTTPINSGNSGGALMNEFGQVIGINSSKIVSTGYEGMAFAIPISDAKEIIDDIIANGYVTDRPKLGISYAAAEKYQQYAMVVKLKDLPSGSLVIASINSD
ncbi:MAG TPA: trypsin, partial [Ruminococcaceae bacterium]|nr:trypsin [Oscillospiraceae bacterium]